MKLSELLKNVKVVATQGNIDVEIKGVNIDSRKIENGHLFIAMKGTQVDGHKFISKAIELGAVAILLEDIPEELNEKVRSRQGCHNVLWRTITQTKVGWCDWNKW